MSKYENLENLLKSAWTKIATHEAGSLTIEEVEAIRDAGILFGKIAASGESLGNMIDNLENYVG